MASVQLVTETQSGYCLGPTLPKAKGSVDNDNFEKLGNSDEL